MTWQQKLGGVLERSTRASRVRRLTRPMSLRGFVPANARQFMHIEPEFDVDADGQTFRYSTTDDDVVGQHLFWTGLRRWEAESWKEFIPLAREARGFLDIGAFTGCYSLVAATVNQRIAVVAFEPVPAVYERLRRNVTLNGFEDRVTTVQAAVSQSVGTTRFYIPDRPLPDTSFLETSNRGTDESGRWHDIPTTTAAQALRDDFHVDLVKIDVEDAEGPVVESMSDLLAEHKPTIFIEFLSTGSYEQASAVLAAIGYRFFHLTDVGRVPVERPAPASGDPYFNYLCVPT